MSTLTERENILMALRGEIPEWVPIKDDAVAGIVPVPSGGWSKGKQEVGDIIFDCLGVAHIVTDPLVSPMPIPGEPHVKDITRWRDFIEMPLPDPGKMDWSRDIEIAASLDRENKLIQGYAGGTAAGTPFNAMVKYLGHEAALPAMLEEKDAWHEMIEVLTDWEVKLIKKEIEVYQPDIIMNADDLSFVSAPFMSLDTYREMIKPYAKRIYQAILEEGVMILTHCCGLGQQFVDDWYEMGSRCWDPAQRMNDLVGIKERYPDFVICGGYDSQGRINQRGVPEEEVRALVREQIDLLAPGGRYIFTTSMMALAHDIGQEHYNWIYDEARKYGKDFYK